MKWRALCGPRGCHGLFLPIIFAAAACAPLACAQDVQSSPREPGPVFSDSGPDAELYGAADGYPLGTRGAAPQLGKLVGSYSHFDEIYPSRRVGRARSPWQFKRAPEPSITYSFGTETLSIADYLKRNPVTGLLIARDDTILYEHYQYARTDSHRFVSQSMAKTLVAMLVGVAVSEGRIKSIDDFVSAYVAGLAGTEYGNTSIRALLNMSSGVEFSEVYDGKDDIARLARALFSGDPEAVETSVAAPIDQVWRAYTTPSDIVKWNAASDDWHTTTATVDLREGGAFSSRMEAKDGSMGFDFAGTYTTIVEHKRIEYSFGDRKAEVEFVPDGKGVVVRVVFDAETTHSVEQQQAGWQAILDNFARYVEAKKV